MEYYIYPLRFLTPVHLGKSDNGGSLDAITSVLSSDTLFSALCHEIKDSSLIQSWAEAVATGKVCISSAFPYCRKKGSYQLFLPKPLYGTPVKNRPIVPWKMMKAVAAVQKQEKRKNLFVLHCWRRAVERGIIRKIEKRLSCLILVERLYGRKLICGKKKVNLIR